MEPIEIKPAGLTTPDGVARVNRAVEAQARAVADAADALRDLLQALEGVEFRDPAIRLAKREAARVHSLRRASDEEFLRALAGHPPRV